MNILHKYGSYCALKLIFVLSVATYFASCKKADDAISNTSSIKIIETISEPKQVRMVPSFNGNTLIYTYSGTLVSPAVKQELFVVNTLGEVIKKVHLSDTIFQFVSAMSGINGGYFVAASSNTLNYISLFHLDDDGNLQWSKNINVTFGTNLNSPAVAAGFDNNYLIMFQSYGSGYYINKTSPDGTEIYNKKIPPPGYIHQGSGLNYGERYDRLFQPNDSMIVIQGITVDEYSQRIENCFIRALSDNVAQKWFSTNYDSTHYENSIGLSYGNDKIVLFGNKSDDAILQGFGSVFARVYKLDATLEKEIIYPQINLTPTTMKRIIPSPDGGYLLVGSHNQASLNDVVSPNNIALMKIRADLSLEWLKSIRTYNPSKGFDAIYRNDGTIVITGLLKSDLSFNKLIYMQLDSNGNLINN